MVLCEICKKEFKSIHSLSMHFSNVHKEINKEEYYLKYLAKEENENICQLCGIEKKFNGFSKKYYRFCSTKCSTSSPEVQQKMKSTNLIKYGVEYSTQNEDIYNKIKQTNLEKYGFEINLKSPEIKEKIKNTLINKYGVDHNLKIPKIKENIKNNYLKKYGVDNPLKSIVIRKQIKKTNLDRYKVENPTQNKEIYNKIQQTNLEKYGAKNPQLNKDIKEKTKKTNLERYEAEYPLQSKTIQNKIKETNIRNYNSETYLASENKKEKTKLLYYNSLFKTKRLKNKVTPLFSLEEYNGIKNKYKFKCNKCHNIFEDNLNNGRIPRCLNCYPTPFISKEEKEIINYIKSIKNDIKIIHSDRTVIYPYELDIYLHEYKLAIEFNGLYWHSESQGKDRNYHLNKTNMCKEKNIVLLHIFEDEWIYKKDIVKSIIKNKLKLNNKIYAKKCNIKEISKNEAKIFINKNDIQEYIECDINIGLFYNNKIISVLSINKLKSDQNYNYKIVTFCSKINIFIVGGFNKLIKYFIKNNYGSIIVDTDLRYDFSDIFLNAGFSFLHKSEPNYYYLKNNNLLRISKQNILENFNYEVEYTINNNLNKIWDCGNNVFIYNN